MEYILATHHPKRQTHPRLVHFGAFHHRMQPVALGVAAHHNQLAVLQQHFAFFLRAFVFEGEFAGGAEA